MSKEIPYGGNTEKRLRNPGLDVYGTVSSRGTGHLFTSPSDTHLSISVSVALPSLLAPWGEAFSWASMLLLVLPTHWFSVMVPECSE